MNALEASTKQLPAKVDNNTLVGLIHRSALPRPLKTFMNTLTSFRNHRNYLCNPAVSTIAQRMGCDESTVWRALRAAKVAGVVSITTTGGGYWRSNVSNSYTIHPEAVINYKRDGNLPPHVRKQGSQIASDGLANCDERDGKLPFKPTKEEPKREPKKATSASTSRSNRRSGSQPLPPLPESLSHGNLPERWDAWVHYRATEYQAGKHPLTATACDILFKKMAKWGTERSCEAIDTAISSGYRAFFEPDRSHTNSHQTSTSPAGTTDAELNAILAQAPSTNRSRS